MQRGGNLMISILSRIFIKDCKNYTDKTVRESYGVLCALVGILLNVLLFAFKFSAGTLSGSIAVTADAFNNLSDAGSSVITLLGFRLAAQKPDSEHPFGHGRFEYISGLIVSMIIVIMGTELVRTSFEKIISPSREQSFGVLSAVILVCSVCVKLYMAFYNTKIAVKINSSAMKATAADSLSDCVATFVVLAGMIISHFANVNIDGWLGLAVAMFIIFAGVGAAKDTISPLLGEPPTKEFVDNIKSIVLAHDKILGVHDIVVHNYGPGRVMISLHAEVSDKSELMQTHDLIDNIERELMHRLGCIAVIHMDPIAQDDQNTRILKERVITAVKCFDERVTVHDFRTVPGTTHTNLVFDVCAPYSLSLSDNEIVNNISDIIKQTLGENYNCVIDVDRDMT